MLAAILNWSSTDDVGGCHATVLCCCRGGLLGRCRDAVSACRIGAIECIHDRKCLSVEDLAHDPFDLLTFLLGHLEPRLLGDASPDTESYPVPGRGCHMLLDHWRQAVASSCSVLTHERVPSVSALN